LYNSYSSTLQLPIFDKLKYALQCASSPKQGEKEVNAMSAQLEHASPYQQDVNEVLANLDTDGQHGLRQPDAHRRLERYGRNELSTEKPFPPGESFSPSFKIL
jgi:magnesium-transporting ATPase (P-type)